MKKFFSITDTDQDNLVGALQTLEKYAVNDDYIVPLKKAKGVLEDHLRKLADAIAEAGGEVAVVKE